MFGKQEEKTFDAEIESDRIDEDQQELSPAVESIVGRQSVFDSDLNLFSDRKYWLSRYALSRVNKNQNFIIIFIGQTGTGKSYDAMSFALDVDPSFSIERIIFEPDAFYEVSAKGLKKGSVIMWDEAGVGMDSRTWYTIQNRTISHVLQTFRRDNIILILTTPSLSFIDKRVQTLIHGMAETIDPSVTNGKFGYVKYQHVIPVPKQGIVYYVYPRQYNASGVQSVLKGKTGSSGNMHFDYPNDEELIRYYEIKKKAFTDQLKEMALETAREYRKTELLATDIIHEIRKIPAMFGFNNELNKRDITDNVYVKLQYKYPGVKISKSEVSAAVSYITTNPNVLSNTNYNLADEKFFIKRFVSSGMSIDDVAIFYGCDVDTIRKIVGDKKK